jgi:hypothetical protein
MFAIFILMLSGLFLGAAAVAGRRHRRLAAAGAAVASALLLWRGIDRLDWHLVVNGLVVVVAVELGALVGAYYLSRAAQPVA